MFFGLFSDARDTREQTMIPSNYTTKLLDCAEIELTCKAVRAALHKEPGAFRVYVLRDSR